MLLTISYTYKFIIFEKDKRTWIILNYLKGRFPRTNVFSVTTSVSEVFFITTKYPRKIYFETTRPSDYPFLLSSFLSAKKSLNLFRMIRESEGNQRDKGDKWEVKKEIKKQRKKRLHEVTLLTGCHFYEIPVYYYN